MRTAFMTFFLLIASLPVVAAVQTQTAIFAGGCFWCMEPPFDKLEGVINTESGYIGGHVKNPDYKAVSEGSTGHAEAIKITYNPTKISYQQLLNVFWENIDPTDAVGQFCDRGNQYRSEIFTTNNQQKIEAIKSKLALENSAILKPVIATEITQAKVFYTAESYHQNYYRRNPIRYKYYRYRCGRDQRLQELWGTKVNH